MPRRVSFLFQIATNPTNRGDASPHIGGWSESFWTRYAIEQVPDRINELAPLRAALLPAQGSLIGFRIANYNIVGNKILPLGSTTGRLQLPGNQNRVTDLPQIALEMTAGGAGVQNQSRFVLRGMPDEIMVGGEYQPDPAFKAAVTRFTNMLNGKWEFLGRDLAQPSANVVSVVGGVLTLSAGIGAAQGDFVRFRRTVDNAGMPVKGTFRVSVVANAGITLTLANFPFGQVDDSGTARVDKINTYGFNNAQPSRAVVKKVGRPFQQYRGRQSKQRA